MASRTTPAPTRRRAAPAAADPDVAAAFPSAVRVTEVFRAVAGIILAQPPAKPGRSRRSA